MSLSSISKSNVVISYFFAIVLGIVFSLLYTTIKPQKQKQQHHQIQEISTEIPTTTSSIPSCSKNTTISTTKLSTPSSFKSCQQEPENCAVLYHSFEIYDSQNTKNNTKSSSSIPKYLWRAILSAASLKSAHHHNNLKTPKILLATNYNPQLIENAKKILHEKVRQVYSSLPDCDKHAKPPKFNNSFLFDSDFFINQKVNSQSNNVTLLQQKKMILELHFHAAKHSSKSSKDLLWPFDEVIYPDEKKKSSEFKFAMKADGLDQSFFPSLAKYKRILYLDSDTFINRPVFEILDAVKKVTKNNFIGMTQENNWHRDLSPFLYEPVLAQTAFVGDTEVKEEDNEIFTASASSHRWWVPHSPVSSSSVKKIPKPSKHNPTPFGHKNHALYELQYNTGMILITQEENGSSQKFIQLWRKLHRMLPRCRNDRVLWDQCSLPIAIRTFKDDERLKFVTLSDRFNFREALGYSCYDSVYKNDDGEEGDLRFNFMKKRVDDGRVPDFDKIVVLHHTEFRFKQDDWAVKVFLF